MLYSGYIGHIPKEYEGFKNAIVPLNYTPFSYGIIDEVWIHLKIFPEWPYLLEIKYPSFLERSYYEILHRNFDWIDSKI